MKCKWMSIANIMRHSVLVFIHKIKINSRLQSLNELFTKSKSNRNVTKTYPIYEPKTKKLKNFLIYKGNKLYNKIPSYLIKTKLNIFKKSLKKYITMNYNPFKLHSKQKYNANSSDSSSMSSDSSC